MIMRTFWGRKIYKFWILIHEITTTTTTTTTGKITKKNRQRKKRIITFSFYDDTRGYRVHFVILSSIDIIKYLFILLNFSDIFCLYTIFIHSFSHLRNVSGFFSYEFIEAFRSSGEEEGVGVSVCVFMCLYSICLFVMTIMVSVSEQ